MHIHGGDIYSREVKYDFSANLNFLGMPQSVIDAACRGVLASDHYPDVHCRALKEAISRKDGVPVGQILCGNGAADLIFALALAEKPRKAVLCAPTFYEYEQALETVDCRIKRVFLREEEGFSYTEELLAALTEDVDLLVLCNPNNPTGVVLSQELLLKILDRCREKDIRVMLDECFVDFLDVPEQVTALSHLDRFPQLFILRAFTKIYAMAGLRLGYAMTSDEALHRKMESVCQPWNVSIPAQMAGVAAVSETAYVERYRSLMKAERAFLKEELQKMGIKIYGSNANYIFFHSIPELAPKMLAFGIAIRDCANYVGLEQGYYRIAVRTHEENVYLIKALKQVLGQ